MTDLATPLLEVDKIEVAEGHNPRTHMDPDALARLAGNLSKTDVVQPLTVRPIDGGKFAVVAGHRRLEAAKLAGIKKVPVHVRRNGNARAAALSENLHREDLDPIDTARGLVELAAELELPTNKKIAEELDVSDSWVSQHLRLLKLPEGVQRYIAEGHVPVEAERDLRGIAEVSPRIAECICELAKRRKVKSREFVVNFGDLFEAVAQARFEDKPTMIDPGAVRLSDVITDEKKRRDLGDRHLAAKPYTHTDNPTLRFGEAEIDAARAAGCLVEHQVDHEGWTSTVAFITDAELAGDLAERHIERIVKENAKQGISRFFVTDDNFARNRNWEPIFDRMIELREGQGYSLHFLIQVDVLAHKIPNFIEKAARAGCRYVFIGLESINPENLVHMKKNQNRIT